MLPYRRPTWNRTASSSYANLLGERADDVSDFYELDDRDRPPPTESAYQASFQEDSSTTIIGKPMLKRFFNPLDGAALLLSVVCLGTCFAVIPPTFNLSFRLGYTNQIVVIGFLLGIMNLCLRRVVLLQFLLLEMKLGPSHLANFDVVLVNSPLTSHVSIVWRVILLSLAILPFGLSASYKLFGGGSVTKTVSHANLTWGIMPPPGLDTAGALIMTANVSIDFLTSANNDSVSPVYEAVPRGYGLNLLMLSPYSAACLDTPKGQDIFDIQNALEPNTFLELTATVRATVDTYDRMVDQNRNNAMFWAPYFLWANISFQNLWSGYAFGFLNTNSATSNAAGAWDDSWAVLGCINSSTLVDGGSGLGKLSESNFESNAMLYNIDRRLCTGNWRIRHDAIELLHGVCEVVSLGPAYQFFQNTQLFLAEVYTPMLITYLSQFCTVRISSQWKIPTFTVSVVSMYYSMMAEQLHTLNGSISSQYVKYFEHGWSPYSTTEITTLTSPVMRQAWSLNIVFACQPFLATIAFCTGLILYRISLARGFGLIAILAGIDRNCLELLRGASISGELREPAKLHAIGITETDGHSRLSRIEYIILMRDKRGGLFP